MYLCNFILGCELMTDTAVKLNEVLAEKICKQTEDLYPYHPVVYKLKERLLTLNGSSDPSKVENLLHGVYKLFLNYSKICKMLTMLIFQLKYLLDQKT